jgi:ribose transport system substrate-binding protein
MAGITALMSTAVVGRAIAANSKVYTIYLSNNFLGNDWRVLMERVATVLAGQPPFAGKVNLKIDNTPQNTPTAQIQQLNNMIAAKPNAILIDASSPEALNATIQKGCDAGILMISFDQIVTAPCAYKIDMNWDEMSHVQAQWIVDVLHGKGVVFADLGIPGFPVSQRFIRGYESVFAKHPDIKIACRFTSEGGMAPEQTGVANCLAGNPSVDAIMSLGFGTGAMNAIKAAGKPQVPVAAETYNSTMLACAQPGQPCLLVSDPAYLSGEAMKLAVEILDGQKPNKPGAIVINSPYFYSNTDHFEVEGMSTAPQKIEPGVNCYPNLPGTVFLPFSPSWATITAEQVTAK